ncbi:hypothetical protein [Emticicia sp. C21]|uniref:hypothetical protein n=1 Tax=Emticicia sp. C21 TaxID=2302915 RepID=UPI000E34B107|nr:hypothetical protein [Emticicia sp. C21]RFS18527.1 hypothetical protein D0T08_04565 [Emticicia sp. C21]
MELNELIENELNEKIPPGSLIKGTVTAQAPFGIFLDIGMDNTNAVVDIVEFLDIPPMAYHLHSFPRLGSRIEAVVLGVHANAYINQTIHQFKLSIKSSRLKEAYELLGQGAIKRIDLGTNRGRIIEKFPIGTLVTGTVSWINFSSVTLRSYSDHISGQIDFTEFLDEGEMDYSFYPLPNTEIETIVIGYTDDDRLKLSAKPSLLQKAREAKIQVEYNS